jgi:hypothetical protein
MSAGKEIEQKVNEFNAVENGPYKIRIGITQPKIGYGKYFH